MYPHILVAVGPGFSEAALSKAIELARGNAARITLLHVIESAPWWAGWSVETFCNMPELVDQLALAIRGHCEKMLANAGMKADWETRRLPEDGHSIGGVIALEANRLDVDLIVLGAGRSSLGGIGMHHVRNIVRRRTGRNVLIAYAPTPRTLQCA
ncbi:universal stress protein [Caballeronia sp. LZ043]|uniref:universal stress protein n=1 Tax=Caballeronia sp. LZ043 TaxID=3038569 RepID=UPI00285C5267|nr:universal stress protein [Caballeronia sp. LZ043]MDR5823762.1 universal stress protein [Caballeronia sp. LZ043]